MNRRIGSLMAVLLFTGTAAMAQWEIGYVYHANCKRNASQPCNELTVVPRTQFGTAYTWYGPDVYQTPAGNLSFIAQAGNPSVNDLRFYLPTNGGGISRPELGRYAPTGIDTFYRAERDVNGNWLTPAFGAAPALKGQARRCDYQPKVTAPPPQDPTFTPNNIDPVGGPSVVRIQTSPTTYKYFMAFNGGNADYITGKLYWAISDDGVNWTPYNWNAPAGYQWTPIVDPYYHDCNGGVQSPTGMEEGVTEPMLAFDPADTSGGPNGTFYLYFSYTHRDTSFNPPAQWLADVIAVRFGYNPGHAFGLGGNYQIFQGGVWSPHSGRLVFSYDAGPTYSPSDVRVSVYNSMTSIGNTHPMSAGGPGDLKRNPDTGQWVRISASGDNLLVQTNSRLDLNNWPAPITVDKTALTNRYSLQCTVNNTTVSVMHSTGLWYGTLGTRRGWWLWVPVPTTLSPCFTGLGMVVTELCEPGGTCTAPNLR